VTDIEIRPARDDDSNALSELLGELGYPTSPAEAASRLGTLRSSDYAVRVAVRDGRVVGLVSLHLVRGLHSSSPACYLMGLVTHSTMHGQGIGTALLQEAEKWARERGCDRVTLTSANHRSAAHAFYEHLGFPQTGRRFAKLIEIEPSAEGNHGGR
jgi:GNAT superfamily N-acetyltransferase